MGRPKTKNKGTLKTGHHRQAQRTTDGMTKIKQTDLPAGVSAITQRGQAIVYTCDPGLFVRAAGPTVPQRMTVTVTAAMPRTSKPDVQGQRRPLSRDDLALWFEEARRTLKADGLPPEVFQVRGATSAWPEIVRGRAEIDAAERGRRELAMGEGRGQTDRAAMPKARPSSAQITRLTLCLGWGLELADEGRRRAVLYRLCGVSFEKIGYDAGVSHEAVRKRHAKGLDDIWNAVSTRATKS